MEGAFFHYLSDGAYQQWFVEKLIFFVEESLRVSKKDPGKLPLHAFCFNFCLLRCFDRGSFFLRSLFFCFFQFLSLFLCFVTCRSIPFGFFLRCFLFFCLFRFRFFPRGFALLIFTFYALRFEFIARFSLLLGLFARCFLSFRSFSVRLLLFRLFSRFFFDSCCFCSFLFLFF